MPVEVPLHKATGYDNRVLKYRKIESGVQCAQSPNAGKFNIDIKREMGHRRKESKRERRKMSPPCKCSPTWLSHDGSLGLLRIERNQGHWSGSRDPSALAGANGVI